MESDVFVPVSHLVRALATLCRDRSTGCMHFISSDDHAGMIMIQAGRIVHVRYFIETDEVALEAIKQLALVKYRYSESGIPSEFESNSLPDTAALLNQLGYQGDLEPEGDSEAVFAPPTLPNTLSSTLSSEATTDSFKDQLDDVLLKLIGPFAPLLTEHLAAKAESPQQLVALILEELPPSERHAFWEQIAPQVGLSLSPHGI